MQKLESPKKVKFNRHYKKSKMIFEKFSAITMKRIHDLQALIQISPQDPPGLFFKDLGKILMRELQFVFKFWLVKEIL